MCGRHLGFSPYGQPSGSSSSNNNSTKYFSMLAAAAVGAGYALFLLPLTLASADFVYFFVLCLFKKTKTTTKSVQFPLCTFHTERGRERRRALNRLWRFVRSMCAALSVAFRPPATYFCFHFVLHFFHFVACLPACVHVCVREWICVCMYGLYRHVYIFIFHIFGLFLPCTHTGRDRHTDAYFALSLL